MIYLGDDTVRTNVFGLFMLYHMLKGWLEVLLLKKKVDNLYETICVVTKYINRKMIPSFHWNFGNSELITSKECISCVIR